MVVDFDFSELTEFEKDLLNLAQKIDKGKEAKKFLRKTGNELKRRTMKHAKAKVKKKSGNLLKGIRRGKVYRYGPTGAWSVRVYAGKPAYHAHLIEYGHRMVTKNGNEVGFVKGKHIFESAAKEYEAKFYDEVGEFLDEMLDEHGL